MAPILRKKKHENGRMTTKDGNGFAKLDFSNRLDETEVTGVPLFLAPFPPGAPPLQK